MSSLFHSQAIEDQRNEVDKKRENDHRHDESRLTPPLSFLPKVNVSKIKLHAWSQATQPIKDRRPNKQKAYHCVRKSNNPIWRGGYETQEHWRSIGPQCGQLLRRDRTYDSKPKPLNEQSNQAGVGDCAEKEKWGSVAADPQLLWAESVNTAF